MNLTRTNWPLGWNPAADAINGDPRSLLRMDNLRIDKTGAIGLIDGMKPLGSGSDFISNIYTRVINGIEYFWSSTGLPVNSVTRGVGAVGGTTLVLQDSPTDRCGFGDALGYIFAVAGNMRVKDPVSSSPLQLGLLTPGKPTVVANSQPTLRIPVPIKVIDGVIPDDGIGVQLDPASLIGTVVTGDDDQTFNLNTTLIGGGTAAAADPNNDIFQINLAVTDGSTDQLNTVEVDFILNGNPSDPSTYKDYFTFTFPGGNDQIPSGAFLAVPLSAKRGDFLRYGNDQTVGWNNVIGVRVHIEGLSQVTCQITNISVIGGIYGALTGTYNYICQAISNNNNVYVGKSPVSDSTDDITVINGSVVLSATGDKNTTKIRYYRRAAVDLGIDPNTGQSLNQSVLPNYYYIGEALPGTQFTDILSDIEVIQLNVDGSLLPNLYLKTLNIADTSNALTDSLYAVEGLFNERMLYLSGSNLYLSDRLNPDAVDSRFTIRPSGDPTEKNLWIKRLTNSVLVLGTSKNLYEISGTLLEQPDGSIDANIIGLGESHPPLCTDVWNFNGGLYYVASDGLRVTRGSNSVNVSPQLRHLFQSGLANRSNPARHGIPAVAIYSDINVNYSIAAAHGKIYFVLPLMDGTRRLFFYDTVTESYGLMYTDPVKVFATQADELLAGYGASGQNAVYLLDYSPATGFNSISGIPITFRTVFDSNEQPRNRKDTFTLKLVLDTGNRPVNVFIQSNGIGVTETDENNYFNLGQYSADGETTIYIDISKYTLGFRYSIQITDVNGLYTFKLYELTLEYEPRPEQLNYFRIPPANLGSISRKRFTSFAFAIDTLGNPVTFTPYLDHAATTSDTVTTLEKSTYVYYFRSNLDAVDIGGILSGGPFEFYGINLEECISEKLPPPCKYLVIPHNNYGTPNRKRHSSYKFQIDTRGKEVKFTPIIDSTSYSSQIFTTFSKKTVEYFFGQSDGDIIGIDIGGILESLENTPFEFYGAVAPQQVEQLPDRLEYFKIPNSNFGSPAAKRLRSIPLVIDTYGHDVNFQPTIDGSDYRVAKIYNTKDKRTVFYYFQGDVFGTDFGGRIYGNNPFEFYGMGEPESIEVLPSPRLCDSLGPMRFDKIGKIFGFRLRLIAGPGLTNIPYSLYGDTSGLLPTNSSPLYQDGIDVLPGYDNIYEVQFPKNINTCIARLVLGPTTLPFYRYDVYMKIQTSGMQTEGKWLPFR